jgi:CSLREA domain-containing protein
VHKSKAYRRARVRGLLLVALLWSLGGLAVAPAVRGATTITVTSTLDEPDTAPGNGTCRGASGGCTLRAAIMEANALAGADTIVVPADTFELTRSGFDDTAMLGDLDITRDVTIVGAGSGRTIVEGPSPDRAIHVRAPAVAIITGVTIQATALDDGLTGEGGAGILNEGTLTLRNASVAGNYSDYGEGAGIANSGMLTLDRVILSGNGARGNGGGLRNSGTARLTGVLIQDNYTIIDGHSAGILNRGRLTITNSTISGNHADSDGGGIVNYGVLTMANTTITGNTAEWSAGGLWNGSGGTATVRSSTIASNIADNDLDGVGTGGGIWNSASLTFSNSIVALNVDSYYNGLATVHTYSDCAGALTSGGANIMAVVRSEQCTINGPVTLADPLLGTLRANGGPTPTRALRSGSPAIDRGNSNCTGKDQRGVARVDGEPNGTVVCDIGAYEFNAPVITGLQPAAAKAGGAAFTLRVTGVRFSTRASVRWNGQNRQTTFVSSTELRAQITAQDIARAGKANVVVVNPQQEMLSAPRIFKINP